MGVLTLNTARTLQFKTEMFKKTKLKIFYFIKLYSQKIWSKHPFNIQV